MAKLPYSREDAKHLVRSGHMSPETFEHAHRIGAFTDSVQNFADGTADVEHSDGENSAPPIDNEGINNGDIHPIDAFIGALSQGGSRDAYEQSLASLPKTPNDVPGAEAPGQIPGGVTVASNDPTVDRQIASNLVQPQTQAQGTTEAGHVPASAIAQPAAPQQDPLQSQVGSDIKQVTSGMSQERQGLADSFKTGEKQAQETAGYLHGMREHMEAAQAQAQQMEDARQAEANAQYQKVQKAADEAAQAGKIDPNHYWANRSTGQKIAAAIGIALGGIGGGLSGHGGNAAMDVINKAIDRDMEAQKFNANQKQAALGNQLSLYGAMRQKFGDERQAEAATQMAYLQSAEMQIRETAAKYQSPEMQARAQMLLGQLQQKQGMLSQQIHASAYQQAAYRQLMSGGNVGAATLSVLPKEVQERLVPMNGGTSHGVAYSPEAAKSVREVASAADNVKSIIAEMRQLKEQGGKRVLPYGTLQAKAQGLQSRLIPALNEMAGLKRLSEEDIKNLKQQIPDPGSWLGEKSDALLSGLEQSVHDRTEGYYKNNLMGYRPSHFSRTR